VLGHGEELEMSEAVLLRVRYQARGQLAVAQPAVALTRPSHPRAEMHLVDSHGLLPELTAPAVRHPVHVTPLILGQPPDHRGDLGRSSMAKASGSVFSRRLPSAILSSYLYRLPRPPRG